jgi:hypothetical protein
MGYLVGLTLVLDQLFVIVLALGSPNLLTQTEINTALDKYTSGAANTVHEEIREYCNDSNFTITCRLNRAEWREQHPCILERFLSALQQKTNPSRRFSGMVV